MKKIYKQWTVKSFDLEKFDNEINSNLEIGWEIVEGSYSISEVDGKKMISQVLVWKDDDDDENLYLDFNLSGEWRDGVMEQTDNELMTISRKFFHRDKKDSHTCIKWKKDYFGGKYSKEEIIYSTYTKDVPTPQLRKKYYKLIDEDGNVSKLIEYNEDGIEHGKHISRDGELRGEMDNGKPCGEWSFRLKNGQVYSGIYYMREMISTYDSYYVRTEYKEEDFFHHYLKENPSGEISLLENYNYHYSSKVGVPILHFKGKIDVIDGNLEILSGEKTRFKQGIVSKKTIVEKRERIIHHGNLVNILEDKEFYTGNILNPWDGFESDVPDKYIGNIRNIDNFRKNIFKFEKYYPDGQDYVKMYWNDNDYKVGLWERYFSWGILNKSEEYFDDHSVLEKLYSSTGDIMYESRSKTYKGNDYINYIEKLVNEKRLVKIHCNTRKEWNDICKVKGYWGKSYEDYLISLIPEDLKNNPRRNSDDSLFIDIKQSTIFRDSRYLYENIHTNFVPGHYYGEIRTPSEKDLVITKKNIDKDKSKLFDDRNFFDMYWGNRHDFNSDGSVIKRDNNEDEDDPYEDWGVW